MAGLNETIRMDVELPNPSSLTMAMNLARAYEKWMHLERGCGLRKSNTSTHYHATCVIKPHNAN